MDADQPDPGIALERIEASLTQIARSASEGAAKDPAVNRSLLWRQVELLLDKSAILRVMKQPDRAQDVAAQAASLAAALASPQVIGKVDAGAELRIRAGAAIGLSQAMRQDWIAARSKLRELARPQETSSFEYAELRATIEREDARRWSQFESMYVDSERYNDEMEARWGEARGKLDEIVKELAHAVGRARAVVATVPFPDVFEQWLIQGLREKLSEQEFERDAAILREELAGEIDDAPAISHARLRGVQVQIKVWASSEMLYAKQLGHSDDELANYRGKAILGVPSPDNPSAFAYPRWQFHGEGGVIPCMPRVLERFEHLPEWSVWTFFHSSSPVLRGLTPLQVLGIEQVHDANPGEALDLLKNEFETLDGAISAAADAYAKGDD